MKKKKTVLIFGLSSFVGSNLAECLKKDFKVVGTYNNNKINIPGVLSIPCNVLEKDEVQLVSFTIKADYTLYCAGLPSLTDCAKSEAQADALNTIGLFNVSEFCQRYKSQIIFFSSAYVFGGDNKTYIEMDIPDSITMLGKTKSSAEFYIQKTSLNYLIFRCCNLYGTSNTFNQTTFFEKLQESIFNQKRITLDGNIHIGFLDVYYIAQLLKMCFERGVRNRLYQVSSEDSITHYEFGKLYTEVFGEGDSLISRGKWPFPHIASSTSSYTGDGAYFKLDICNVESYLNIKMPTVKESIEFTYKRLHGAKSAGRGKQSSGISFI